MARFLTDQVNKILRAGPDLQASKLSEDKLDPEARGVMLVVTDKEQKTVKRMFTGEMKRNPDGSRELVIAKTLNADTTTNPGWSVEILDKPVILRLKDNKDITEWPSITQEHADQLQQLMKSGKLVKAEPARDAELDALLAKGPSGQAGYEGAPRTPASAVGNKGLAENVRQG